MSILSFIKNNAQTAKTWLRGSGKAALPVTFGALGIYTEYMTTGKEYGAGAGILKGAAYAMPWVGGAMLMYDVGKGIGDYSYQRQQNMRKSSFRQGMYDPFGNNATMRQRSSYNINRGRSAIGQEAYLFR